VALGRLMLLLWAALALLLPSCRCSDTDVIAQLVEMDGQVQRDWESRQEQWETTAVGAEFRMGDGVRSRDQSSAALRLTGDARLKLTPNTVVRFLTDTERGHVGLDVAVGTAELETKSEALRINSSIGVVVIDPGTQLQLRKSERGLRFAIAVGRARIEHADGATSEVGAGKGIEIGIGGVVLDRFDFDPKGGTQASTAPSAASAEAPEDTKADIIANTTGANADRRAPGGSWEKLPAGTTKLAPGTGIRVGRATTVEVQRGRQKATLNQGEFVVGVPGGYLIQAVKGPVRLTSGGRTSVSVPGGVIVARGSNTSAEVEAGGEQGTRVQVHVGEVEVRGRKTDVLGGGESGLLSRDGELSISGRGPSQVDLVVNAGEDFTVHDPKPPTAIGFRLGGKCPQGSVLSLGAEQWASRGAQVNAAVSTGRHSYQVRCLGPDGPQAEVVAQGRAIVLRDAGTAPIASKAPVTHVNADGRRYTVLYQNRLPKITVGWAAAPVAPSYTLIVDGRSIRTSSPNHAFGSGRLGEGRHTIRFRAATNPLRRSRPTTIVISFDNATPTASLDALSDTRFTPDSSVTIAGKSLPGWQVSVGGKELKLDGQSRFSGEVKVPEGHSALTVKFSHPRRGTHYYLRRPKRKP